MKKKNRFERLKEFLDDETTKEIIKENRLGVNGR